MIRAYDTQTDQYWEHITNDTSVFNFRRAEKEETMPLDSARPLISVEALPESGTMLDFKAFAREYPHKLFRLLDRLRPEFKELFIEYYILGKSQYFLGPVHGQIQTRVWQNLRIIEQAIGAMIVLGTDPTPAVLRPILHRAGLEDTTYGPLSEMIYRYAQLQSYVKVAKTYRCPAPVIRKIFRPAIQTLLSLNDLKATAVGAYLHNLTHQASLTKSGFSKSYLRRLKKVRNVRIEAPPTESALVSWGDIAKLGSTPWTMLEASPDYKASEILQSIRQSRFVFRGIGQIFMPINENGDLQFGYFFARGIGAKQGNTRNAVVTALSRVRGVSEIAERYDNQGAFVENVEIPHTEIQKMISDYELQITPLPEVGDFVEVLTGSASRYCGSVVSSAPKRVVVRVDFPSGRQFTINADPSSIKILPSTPEKERNFWGIVQDAETF